MVAVPAAAAAGRLVAAFVGRLAVVAVGAVPAGGLVAALVGGLAVAGVAVRAVTAAATAAACRWVYRFPDFPLPTPFPLGVGCWGVPVINSRQYFSSLLLQSSQWQHT